MSNETDFADALAFMRALLSTSQTANNLSGGHFQARMMAVRFLRAHGWTFERDSQRWVGPADTNTAGGAS